MELQSMMAFFTLEGAGGRPSGHQAAARTTRPQAKAKAGNLRPVLRAPDESSGEFTRF